MPATRKLTRKQLELAIAGGTASLKDFEGWDPEVVLEIKQALPVQYRPAVLVEHVPLLGKAMVYPAMASDDPRRESRTVDLAANVQVPDRMGDLILSDPKDAAKYDGEGWITEYFDLAGGPYLYLHDPYLVVGKVEGHKIAKVEVPERDAARGKAAALVISTRFFDSDLVPWARAAWLLTAEGITASSVGFRPKKIVLIEDEKERQKLGLGKFGWLVVTQELLEVSKAPIPANQVSVGLPTKAARGEQEKTVEAALRRFVERGELSQAEASDFRRAVPLGPQDAEERLRARLRGWMTQAVLPDGRHEVTLECLDGACELAGERRTAAAPTTSRAGRWPPPVTGASVCTGRCDCSSCQERARAAEALKAVREAVGCAEGDCVVEAVRAVVRDANEEGAPAIAARLKRIVERAFDRSSELTEDLRELLEEAESGEEDEEKGLDPAGAPSYHGSSPQDAPRRSGAGTAADVAEREGKSEDDPSGGHLGDSASLAKGVPEAGGSEVGAPHATPDKVKQLFDHSVEEILARLES